MEHWTVFSLAFAAVVVHAWLCRREDPHWYLGCIVPLLYGGAVAGMFLGDDLLLALRIILFGAVLPVAGLLWLWRSDRDREPPEEDRQEQE